MMMNNSTHPDNDSLFKFLDNPNDANISLHLAGCSTCRHEVARLTSLSEQLISYKRNDAHHRMDSMQNMEKLNKLLNLNCSKQQREEFKIELQNDKNLLREALHFSSHSTAMKNGLMSNVSVSNSPGSKNTTYSKTLNGNTTSRRTLLDMVIQNYKNIVSWQPPLWAVATVTACLLISITINLQTMNTAPSSLSVAAYQDNPVMTFTSQQGNAPGIGFFSNIRSTTQPFSNVQIKRSDRNTLSMSWPKVVNAIDYTISLYQITPYDRNLIEEQKIKINSATFSALPLPLNNISSRFEWSLTGVTTDKKSFRALGGFIIR